MKVTYLNLHDLDEIIRKYEEKYEAGSVDMLKDASVRSRISEDELLQWEACITQRRRLVDYNAEVHRGYLQPRHAKRESKASVAYDPEKYAA
ncbi:MAG: hypothetical protein ACRD4F_10195 [Candidatus Angelobacter sp.]